MKPRQVLSSKPTLMVIPWSLLVPPGVGGDSLALPRELLPPPAARVPALLQHTAPVCSDAGLLNAYRCLMWLDLEDLTYFWYTANIKTCVLKLSSVQKGAPYGKGCLVPPSPIRSCWPCDGQQVQASPEASRDAISSK